MCLCVCVWVWVWAFWILKHLPLVLLIFPLWVWLHPYYYVSIWKQLCRIKMISVQYTQLKIHLYSPNWACAYWCKHEKKDWLLSCRKDCGKASKTRVVFCLKQLRGGTSTWSNTLGNVHWTFTRRRHPIKRQMWVYCVIVSESVCFSLSRLQHNPRIFLKN